MQNAVYENTKQRLSKKVLRINENIYSDCYKEIKNRYLYSRSII